MCKFRPNRRTRITRTMRDRRHRQRCLGTGGGLPLVAGPRRARLRARRPRGRSRQHGRPRRARARHRASSFTTSATTRCSADYSASSASRRTSRRCRSRSAAAAAGSSTPVGGRSPSRRMPRGRVSSRCSGRSGAGCVRRAPEDDGADRSPGTSTRTATRSGSAATSSCRLTSALWSTAPGRALEFPAAYAIRFFDNHGMLGFGRFRWRTVTGGSRRYVDAIAARLGSRLRLGSGVRSVRRDRGRRRAARRRGRRALRPGRRRDARRPGARAARGRRAPTSGACSAASRTRRNDAVLHTDSRFLPRNRRARASWNYRLGDARPPDDHLPPEPAAGARGRPRLLRDAERARPGGARARALHLRPPALHGRDAARASGAAAARGGANALRRRVLRQRLPRGRARERRRRRRAPSGCDW